MKKLKQFSIFFALFSIVLSLVLFLSGTFHKDDAIYIALAGPFSNEYEVQGRELLDGAQMYVDEVNQNGGVNGKKIELLIFDNQGDAEIAKQNALKIAQDDRILGVLGHYYSGNAIAAGPIYQEVGIPAVTGTATAQEVIEGNEWFFRVIFDGNQEMKFLANYVKKVLKKSKVGLIYHPETEPSRSITEVFEQNFRALEGEISAKIPFKYDGNWNQEINALIASLVRLKDDPPDILFLSTIELPSTKIIVALRRRGIDYPIIASSSLGNDITTLNLFNQYPEEQAQPGYFSNGIYAVSPIIFDTVGEQGQNFRNEFIERYNHEPSYSNVGTYEAAQVLIEAIQKTGVKGNSSNIAVERKNIRDYLTGINSPSKGIEGVNGLIYFNRERNAERFIPIGVYDSQRFISALTQLYPVRNKNTLNPDNTVYVGKKLMRKTQVVYTGIELNKISNIDQKTSSYSVDFNLWFRFSDEINADDIQFTNFATERLDSGEQLKLDEPIEEIISQGEIYRLYQMEADFQENFLFQSYPFDEQKLSVKFRHVRLPKSDLLYVIDSVGMGDLSNKNLLQKFKNIEVLGTIADWKLKAVRFFSDSIIRDSSFGKKELLNTDTGIEYSQFNAVVYIKRDTLIFSLKNLLPLLFFIIVSYLILFLPFEEISVEAVSGVLLAIVFFHLSLIEALPEGVGYVVALDYAFYIIYTLIILQLLFVVIGRKVVTQQTPQIFNRLIIGSRFTYIGVLIAAVAIFSFQYNIFDVSVAQSNKPSSDLTESINSSKSKPTENESTITLTLGSMQVDAEEPTQRFLEEFYQQNPEIKVEFVPIIPSEYHSVISKLFSQKNAPDLVLVEPYAAGESWYQASYLEPLNKQKILPQNYSQETLQSWSTSEGQLYALPMMGISRGIYYNIDIFNQLNLTIPQTWEELLSVSKTIQEAGYIPFANGTGGKGAVINQLVTNLSPTFLGGAEGRIAYEQGKQCFNDRRSQSLFQALADLRPFLPANKTQLIYNDSFYLFADGKAAMWFNASWGVYGLNTQTSQLNWSVFAVPPPTGKSTHVNFEPFIALGINKASQHKSEARKLLTWFSNPQVAERYANEIPGYFPLHQHSVQIQNQQAQTFLNLKAKHPTDIGWGSKLFEDGELSGYSLLGQNALAVINNGMSPSEAANAVQYGLAQWFEPAQKCIALRAREQATGNSGDVLSFDSTARKS